MNNDNELMCKVELDAIILYLIILQKLKQDGCMMCMMVHIVYNLVHFVYPLLF